MTTNYGLLGGTLDATKHIEAALSQLCTPDEQRSYRDTILPAPNVVPKERMN